MLVLAAAFALSTPITQAQEPASAAASELAELVTQGEPIFAANCKSCHGAAGGGFVGPKLVGNDRIANADFVVRQITRGGSDMPAFGKRLTPEEVRAVGTYIRNSWGNAYGVLPE